MISSRYPVCWRHGTGMMIIFGCFTVAKDMQALQKSSHKTPAVIRGGRRWSCIRTSTLDSQLRGTWIRDLEEQIGVSEVALRKERGRELQDMSYVIVS